MVIESATIVFMNILVVEDDKANAELINKLLSKEGYEVSIVHTFKEASEKIDEAFFALIILDWNLPDGSGYDFLKETRELLIDSQVLMLSANSDLEYRVKALNSGADDYLCKPYALIELSARVKSLLRRTDTNKNSKIVIKNIVIDREYKEVRVDDILVPLTSAEYEILEALASNPKKTFTKSELLSISHNEYDSSVMSNIVEVHIKNIRKKLGRKELIKNVRSVGYKITL